MSAIDPDTEWSLVHWTFGMWQPLAVPGAWSQTSVAIAMARPMAIAVPACVRLMCE
jgi:hypothetical protein